MNLFNLAFLAPVFMAWGTIKQVFARIGAFLVASGELRGQLAHHMHAMLWQDWKVIPLSARRHSTIWLSLKALSGNTGPVVMASYQGAVLFRKGYKIVSWEPKAGNKGRLLCIRGHVNYDKMVAEATARLYAQADGFVQQKKGFGAGFYISRFQGENVSANRGLGAAKTAASSPQLSAPSPKTSQEGEPDLDDFGSSASPCHEIYPLVMRDGSAVGCADSMPPLQRHYIDPAMQVLLKETQTWLSGVSWMRDRGIPHRRGILLEGRPGTGKSSFVKALAEHFQIRLVVVELATCSDYDLPQIREMSYYPSIFLFEDIDRVFEGSTNITEREADKVTFDAFLNLLSGADSLQGLVVLTTNHPEKLDEALIRPGRVDRRIVVPLLNSEGRRIMAGRIMEGCDPKLIARTLVQAVDQPAAEFENTCIQASMEWYWTTHLEGVESR